MDNNKFIDCKFRLVILAAKRAKQLVRGSKKKINMHAENPLTIALKEIELGLINFKYVDEASGQMDLESFEALGNDIETSEEDDLLSLAGDDEDEDYIDEAEDEEQLEEDAEDDEDDEEDEEDEEEDLDDSDDIKDDDED